jgi:hypothetical protein
VINWCLKLQDLDGSNVTKKEFLKAEWLYSQGKGRRFRPGQNGLLIEYLIKACPLGLKESIVEETRLSKVLEQKENLTKSYEAIDMNQKFAEKKKLSAGEKKFDSSTYSRKTGSNIALELKNNYNYEITNSVSATNQDGMKTIAKNSIYFSSSDSVCYGDNKLYFNDKMESDSSETTTTTTDHKAYAVNKSRYDEYDSKPIKPLDPHLLNRKLEEYPEMSKEEIEEEIKRKNLLYHVRAKTIDQHHNPQPNKSNNLKSNDKMPLRQLSFNGSNSNHKINQLSGAKSGLNINNKVNTTPVKLRKRSRTQDAKTTVANNNNPSPSVVSKSKVKYNPGSYSPKINKSTVPSKVDHLRRDKSPKKELLLLDESASVLLNVSHKTPNKDQQQKNHLEMQSKLQKQR